MWTGISQVDRPGSADPTASPEGREQLAGRPQHLGLQGGNQTLPPALCPGAIWVDVKLPSGALATEQDIFKTKDS